MITLPHPKGRPRNTASGRETGPIGLVLAHEAVHMAQITRCQEELRLRAVVSIPYPESREALLASPRELRRLVREASKNHDFHGKQVATALPPEEVKLLFVNYTVNNVQNEEEMLIRTLKERIEGDLGEYVLDYIPVRENNYAIGQRSALVAATKRTVVVPYLEALRRGGLVVSSLEIGPSAIRRLVTNMRSQDDYGNVLVITFGRAKSYLTVLSGRRLLFDREIAFGEDKLLLRLGEALEMSSQSAEELIRHHGLIQRRTSEKPKSEEGDLDVCNTLVEILKPSFLECLDALHQVLVYTLSETHGRSIEQIYLMGSIAHWPGVDLLLAGLIEVPVVVLDPLTAFGSPPPQHEHCPWPCSQTSITTGLALRGLVTHA